MARVTVEDCIDKVPVMGPRMRQNEVRSGRMWASRPLDLDIICYKGRVLGWRRVRRLEPQRGRPDSTSPHLILPHPRAHHRGFVMQPLAEICPRWHHPVFGNTAGQMLSGLAAGRSPLQIAG